MEKTPYRTWADDVLRTEAQGILHLADTLDSRFALAVDAVLHTAGRTVVMGVGKSGHIGRKIAATLASTGTPAYFVHPTEAAHGDLGMIVDGDLVIALSNSGESDEMAAVLPVLKRRRVQIIAFTGKPQSTLARHADILLHIPVEREACPLGLAPTVSTTAALALGDALAVAVMRARSFTSEDFAMSHPAGSLGKRLLLTVDSIMHAGDALPAALPDTPLKEAVVRMSGKGLGMLLIRDESGRLQGILTDGDLRRLFEKYDSFSGLTAGDIMHPNPKTVAAGRLAAEALKIMQQYKISGLPVVDAEGYAVGALNMHDLLRAGIV